MEYNNTSNYLDELNLDSNTLNNEKSSFITLEQNALSLKKEEEDLNQSYNFTRIEFKSYWLKLTQIYEKIEELDQIREKLIKQCVLSSCPIEFDDNDFFLQYKSTYYPNTPNTPSSSIRAPTSSPVVNLSTFSPSTSTSVPYDLVDTRTRARVETARLLRVQLARQQELLSMKNEIEKRLESGRKKLTDLSLGLKDCISNLRGENDTIVRSMSIRKLIIEESQVLYDLEESLEKLIEEERRINNFLKESFTFDSLNSLSLAFTQGYGPRIPGLHSNPQFNDENSSSIFCSFQLLAPTQLINNSSNSSISSITNNTNSIKIIDSDAECLDIVLSGESFPKELANLIITKDVLSYSKVNPLFFSLSSVNSSSLIRSSSSDNINSSSNFLSPNKNNNSILPFSPPEISLEEALDPNFKLLRLHGEDTFSYLHRLIIRLASLHQLHSTIYLNNFLPLFENLLKNRASKKKIENVLLKIELRLSKLKEIGNSTSLLSSDSIATLYPDKSLKTIESTSTLTPDYTSSPTLLSSLQSFDHDNSGKEKKSNIPFLNISNSSPIQSSSQTTPEETNSPTYLNSASDDKVDEYLILKVITENLNSISSNITTSASTGNLSSSKPTVFPSLSSPNIKSKIQSTNSSYSSSYRISPTKSSQLRLNLSNERKRKENSLSLIPREELSKNNQELKEILQNLKNYLLNKNKMVNNSNKSSKISIDNLLNEEKKIINIISHYLEHPSNLTQENICETLTRGLKVRALRKKLETDYDDNEKYEGSLNNFLMNNLHSTTSSNLPQKSQQPINSNQLNNSPKNIKNNSIQINTNNTTSNTNIHSPPPPPPPPPPPHRGSNANINNHSNSIHPLPPRVLSTSPTKISSHTIAHPSRQFNQSRNLTQKSFPHSRPQNMVEIKGGTDKRKSDISPTKKNQNSTNSIAFEINSLTKELNSLKLMNTHTKDSDITIRNLTIKLNKLSQDLERKINERDPSFLINNIERNLENTVKDNSLNSTLLELTKLVKNQQVEIDHLIKQQALLEKTLRKPTIEHEKDIEQIILNKSSNLNSKTNSDISKLSKTKKTVVTPIKTSLSSTPSTSPLSSPRSSKKSPESDKEHQHELEMEREKLFSNPNCSEVLSEEDLLLESFFGKFDINSNLSKGSSEEMISYLERKKKILEEKSSEYSINNSPVHSFFSSLRVDILKAKNLPEMKRMTRTTDSYVEALVLSSNFPNLDKLSSQDLSMLLSEIVDVDYDILSGAVSLKYKDNSFSSHSSESISKINRFRSSLEIKKYFRTKIIKENLFPEWEESFYIENLNFSSNFILFFIRNPNKKNEIIAQHFFTITTSFFLKSLSSYSTFSPSNSKSSNTSSPGSNLNSYKYKLNLTLPPLIKKVRSPLPFNCQLDISLKLNLSIKNFINYLRIESEEIMKKLEENNYQSIKSKLYFLLKNLFFYNQYSNTFSSIPSPSASNTISVTTTASSSSSFLLPPNLETKKPIKIVGIREREKLEEAKSFKLRSYESVKNPQDKKNSSHSSTLLSVSTSISTSESLKGLSSVSATPINKRARMQSPRNSVFFPTITPSSKLMTIDELHSSPTSTPVDFSIFKGNVRR